MALIHCFECGTEISEFADKCPKCGCPITLIKEKENILLYKNNQYDLTVVSRLLKQGEDVKAIKILMDRLQISALEAKIMVDVFKFNSCEIPYNYDSCLKRMQECNQKRIVESETNKPKCPICGSTNVGPLSTFERLLGAFSMGRSRLSWVRVECKNCGHMW